MGMDLSPYFTLISHSPSGVSVGTNLFNNPFKVLAQVGHAAAWVIDVDFLVDESFGQGHCASDDVFVSRLFLAESCAATNLTWCSLPIGDGGWDVANEDQDRELTVHLALIHLDQGDPFTAGFVVARASVRSIPSAAASAGAWAGSTASAGAWASTTPTQSRPVKVINPTRDIGCQILSRSSPVFDGDLGVGIAVIHDASSTAGVCRGPIATISMTERSQRGIDVVRVARADNSSKAGSSRNGSNKFAWPDGLVHCGEAVNVAVAVPVC